MAKPHLLESILSRHRQPCELQSSPCAADRPVQPRPGARNLRSHQAASLKGRSTMHLIRDLKIWQKFLLIAAIAVVLCAPPTVLLVLGQTRTLQSDQDERAGIAPVGALLQLIRQTQIHRGVSAQWLGGNDSLQSTRQTRAAELDKAMEAMRSTTAIYVGGRLEGRRAAVLRQWLALRADVASTSALLTGCGLGGRGMCSAKP